MLDGVLGFDDGVWRVRGEGSEWFWSLGGGGVGGVSEGLVKV